MAKSAQNDGLVEIKPLNKVSAVITIKGTSSLIVHAWSKKAIQMMEDKQQKTTKTKGKDARIPTDEFEEAKHKNTAGQDCFPADGIKAAIVRAGQDCDIPMTQGRRMVFISAIDGDDLIPIISDPAVIRTDMVRIGMGTSDLRYRPEYKNWSMTFKAVFDADNTTLEQVVNLLNRAGSFVGIGEWRMLGKQSSGTHGAFEVA